VLIKQFTHALTWASDPAKALASFDHFLDLIVKDQGKKGKNQALDFVSNKRTFPLLADCSAPATSCGRIFFDASTATSFHCSQNTDAPLIKPQATLRKELDVGRSRHKDESRKKP
jgi:glutamate-ammonia-ligase adenylyltransferase